MYFHKSSRAESYELYVNSVGADGLRLDDKYLAGPDLNEGRLWQDTTIYRIVLNAGAAKAVNKIRLQPRPYLVNIQGSFLNSRLKTVEFTHSPAVPLWFTPELGHKYEVGGKTDGTH